MGMQPTGNVFKVKKKKDKKTVCKTFFENLFCCTSSLLHLNMRNYISCGPVHLHLVVSVISFLSNSLTLSDKKSLKQISQTSLRGFNRVAVDMEPPKGDIGLPL